MIKLKLTEKQMEDFTAKLFKLNFTDSKCGGINDQEIDVQMEAFKFARDSINAYNCVVENIDFPGISVVKNCCLICEHVELIRPYCRENGNDVSLECTVCDDFKLNARVNRIGENDQ